MSDGVCESVRLRSVSLRLAVYRLPTLTLMSVELRSGIQMTRSIILVEGESDRAALQTLATRRGLDLHRAGVELNVIGGAHAIGPYLRGYREREDHRRLRGLYDAGEEAVFRRGLERHGFGAVTGRRELEERGFFCCHRDLEEELIRALGASAVLGVVAGQGDAQRFRTLQHQPEWRERPIESQLRRFMGSAGRRKIRYGRLLVEALALDRVPRPLDAVLEAALVLSERGT